VFTTLDQRGYKMGGTLGTGTRFKLQNNGKNATPSTCVKKKKEQKNISYPRKKTEFSKPIRERLTYHMVGSRKNIGRLSQGL